MIVAWHIVVGLREITHIVVEIIPPFKIVSVLAHIGEIIICPPTRIIVAWDIVVGLR